jgi:uncharacterized protein (DUF2141 family)
MFATMKIRYILYCLFICSASYFISVSVTGCAQIGYPNGGARDTIPPELVLAVPAERNTNFSGNKITLTFNEYIDIRDIQTNLLVSPYPKRNPEISNKLKTVTIKLKDTLLPNTTYAIDFGTALRDLNEGNPFRDYTYVFSTGNTIDSLKLSGTVLLAESGKIDSTLIAMLYKGAVDSSVEHRKPDYIARLNAKGNFTFKNLSPGSYKLYALKDGDGGKTYNSAVETFAFTNNDIIVSDTVKPVTLYAYAEEKDSKKNTNAIPPKTAADKKLKVTIPVNAANSQDLLSPLKIAFNRPLKDVDENKILLTDTLFKKIPGAKFSIDSSRKIISFAPQWAEDFDYILLIDKEAVTDSTGAQLAKTDTTRFKSKGKANYGNLVLRFVNYDAAKHPVLQFFKGDEMIKSVQVTTGIWSDKLFEPGEYDLRVLYDENNNGKWDAGSYKEKRQPEKAITLPKKLSVKAGWDNEKDIEL